MKYESLVTTKDWNNYFLSELKQKGFTDANNIWRSNSSTYRFVHFSPNLRKILEDGSVNISGGGLMAAVYVTPMRADGKIHNLGQYIYEVEFLQSLNSKKVECLIFEISEEQYLKSQIGGKFNYIFKSSHYVQKNLSKSIIELHRQVLDEIDVLLNLDDTSLLQTMDAFFGSYTFLKHVYFETINEYLYIRQDSPEALAHLKKGEVYARNIKNYLFDLTPKLQTNFSTTHFITDTKIHVNNFESSSSSVIIEKFDAEDFIDFLSTRIRFYLKRLLEQPDALLGRLLLKTETEVSKVDIQQKGADKLKGEVDGIVLYQYESIPKGEYGIASSNEVVVYRADYSNGIVEQKERIDVKINQSLTRNHQSILRVK